MTIYIQRKQGRDIETIDEFSNRKDARAALAEYRIADPSADYYLSQRACKHWNN